MHDEKGTAGGTCNVSTTAQVALSNAAVYSIIVDVQVFENSIYLFFTHPFDIGDEIRFEGSRYTVKSMTLQVVKLTSVVGADVIVPTAEMRNSCLHNITRCSFTLPSLLHKSVFCPHDFRRNCFRDCQWDSGLCAHISFARLQCACACGASLFAPGKVNKLNTLQSCAKKTG